MSEDIIVEIRANPWPFVRAMVKARRSLKRFMSRATQRPLEACREWPWVEWRDYGGES